jgi:hypothetical protein
MMKRLIMLTVLVGVALGGCGGSASHHASTGGSGPLASAATPGAGGGAPAAPAAPAASAARGVHRRHARAAHARASTRSQSPSAAVGASDSPSVAAQPAVANAPSVPPSFASQADAVCSSYRQNVSGLHLSASLTEQEKVFPTILSEAHAAISRLSALTPPRADTAAFTAYIRLTAAAVADFVKAQAKSRSTKESVGVAQMQKNVATYRALGRVVTAAGGIARHLGMRVCGSAGSDWL